MVMRISEPGWCRAVQIRWPIDSVLRCLIYEGVETRGRLTALGTCPQESKRNNLRERGLLDGINCGKKN